MPTRGARSKPVGSILAQLAAAGQRARGQSAQGHDEDHGAAGHQARRCHLNPRADKSMLLFMKTRGQESFLPAMYQISQEWKKNKDSGGKVKSPLRIVLLKCYLSEMTARLEKATKDPDTRAAVLKAAWAVESSGSSYGTSSSTTRKSKKSLWIQV